MHAVPPQQLGGPQTGMHTSFGSQQIEDPALFVTFDEEDDEFPVGNRQLARSQPVQVRRQPPQLPPQHNTMPQLPAGNRQQPVAGTTARASARPASAGPSGGPGKTLSAAEQELEDLKRRIAEKEKQMKAKRQTGQGYSSMPVRSRPNPAHGPVLRGLHRQQSASSSQNSPDAEAFLKQVAAELPPAALGSCRDSCMQHSAACCSLSDVLDTSKCKLSSV